MTSSAFFLKDPISVYSHAGNQRFNIGMWEGCNSVHNNVLLWEEPHLLRHLLISLLISIWIHGFPFSLSKVYNSLLFLFWCSICHRLRQWTPSGLAPLPLGQGPLHFEHFMDSLQKLIWALTNERWGLCSLVNVLNAQKGTLENG